MPEMNMTTKLAAALAGVGIIASFFSSAVGPLLLLTAFTLFAFGLPSGLGDEERPTARRRMVQPALSFDDYLAMPEHAPAPSVARYSPLTVVESPKDETPSLTVLPEPVEFKVLVTPHRLSVVEND